MGRAGGRRAGKNNGDQLTGDVLDDLVAELVAYGCGTWRDVMHGMGLREAMAMGRAWEHCPPIAVMVARYFGIEPKQTHRQGDLAELCAMFGVVPGSTGTMK